MEVVGAVVEDDDGDVLLLVAHATVEAVDVQIGILTWTCQTDNDIQNDFVWKAPLVLLLCYVAVQQDQDMEQEKAETVRRLLLYLLL